MIEMKKTSEKNIEEKKKTIRTIIAEEEKQIDELEKKKNENQKKIDEFRIAIGNLERQNSTIEGNFILFSYLKF